MTSGESSENTNSSGRHNSKQFYECKIIIKATSLKPGEKVSKGLSTAAKSRDSLRFIWTHEKVSIVQRWTRVTCSSVKPVKELKLLSHNMAHETSRVCTVSKIPCDVFTFTDVKKRRWVNPILLLDSVEKGSGFQKEKVAHMMSLFHVRFFNDSRRRDFILLSDPFLLVSRCQPTRTNGESIPKSIRRFYAFTSTGRCEVNWKWKASTRRNWWSAEVKYGKSKWK